jgi:hypothetical protein
VHSRALSALIAMYARTKAVLSTNAIDFCLQNFEFHHMKIITLFAQCNKTNYLNQIEYAGVFTSHYSKASCKLDSRKALISYANLIQRSNLEITRFL